MKRLVIFSAVVILLPAVYVAGHLTLIEWGREIAVLKTRDAAGDSHESRLWVVDHAGHGWLHGSLGSGWIQRIAANPGVSVAREGESRGYRATIRDGAHPEIDELLRAKYGVADQWVRFIRPDGEDTVTVRLDPL